jgi:glycine betaine/choline ABC-type transport system substrate-binding protein
MVFRGSLRFAPVFLTLLFASCRHSAPAIVIGSQNTTEQALVAEIVAQHVENRLGLHVTRRLGVGGTLIAYQGMQSGEIGIYPEYSGTIITEILKEQPASDADQVFQRAKGEMARIAQVQLVGPLGVDNSFVGVVRSADPDAAKVSNLSEAAQAENGWKLAYSFEFQQKSDTVPALTQYHLPMSAPVRALDPAALFKSLHDGQSSLIMIRTNDGQLRSPEWKVLADDRKLFTTQQLCLIVRQGVLTAEPRLAGALAELSGKFSNKKMRELNAQVDIDNRPIAAVAKSFLDSLH